MSISKLNRRVTFYRQREAQGTPDPNELSPVSVDAKRLGEILVLQDAWQAAREARDDQGAVEIATKLRRFERILRRAENIRAIQQKRAPFAVALIA